MESVLTTVHLKRDSPWPAFVLQVTFRRGLTLSSTSAANARWGLRAVQVYKPVGRNFAIWVQGSFEQRGGEQRDSMRRFV